jgi:hypothetical protein
LRGAQGKAERSARLFGAAEGLLKTIRTTVYNYYTPNLSRYEHTICARRSRLGESAIEEARERRREMNFEQVVHERMIFESKTAS